VCKLVGENVVKKNVQRKIREICGKIRKAMFHVEKKNGYCSTFDSDFQITFNFAMIKLLNFPPK